MQRLSYSRLEFFHRRPVANRKLESICLRCFLQVRGGDAGALQRREAYHRHFCINSGGLPLKIANQSDGLSF